MTRYGDRKAVVIGGTGGLGLAVSKRLVEGGAKILLTGHAPARAAAELGSCAQVIGPDPADPAAVAALALTVEIELGRIDYLFLPTGRSTALALLPALKDGGAVVFTTSRTLPALRALAAELAAHGARGIRVNAVAPDCPGAGRRFGPGRAGAVRG
ncbi:SDR family NAD(P)-dependent oxidoreductase, partial [Streptomyces beijiangensis]